MKRIALIVVIIIVVVFIFLFGKHSLIMGKGQNNSSDSVSLGSKESFFNDFNSFLMEDQLKYASVGFLIYDPVSEKTIFEYNPDMALVPASVAKVISTASALEILGKDTSFSTLIGYDGELYLSRRWLKGNIIIKGGGDPCLGSGIYPSFYNNPDFISSWAEYIKKAGIDSINGNIIADDRVFDMDVVPDDWSFIDIPAYYGTAPFGLSVYDNTYNVILSTKRKGRFYPGKDSIEPFIPFISFENHISNTAGQASYLDLHGSYFEWNRILKGNLPKAEKLVEIKGSIPDPPFLLAYQLYEKLLAKGVKIKGEPNSIRKMTSNRIVLPDEFKRITSTNSPNLAEIVKRTNMVSQNLYAEHLLIHCGIKSENIGNTKAGAQAILDFWKSKSINVEGMSVTDGSGISRSNSFSAHHLVDILNFMLTKSRNKDVFYKSLPISGESGTMKNFGEETIIQGKIRAKSGSMTRVRSYAGYMINKDGKEYVFAIIINNFTGKPIELRNKIEKLFISSYENL